jgi:transcription elongation factor Elf1
VKKRPQLTADEIACPYCGSENCVVKQMGHFVNTLQLICFVCQRAANFRGPEVIFTKALEKQEVRERFEEPAF